MKNFSNDKFFISSNSIERFAIYPAFFVLFREDSLDYSDRPILEGRSTVYRVSNEDYIECKYKDVRCTTNRPMNKAALTAYKRVFDDIALLLGDIRREVDRFRGGDWHDLNPVHRLASVALVGYKCISYFSLVDGLRKVPKDISAFYKLSHGLFTLTDHVFRNLNFDDTALKSADDFYAYANRHSLLVGRGEVCAGSPYEIKRIIGECLLDNSTVRYGKEKYDWRSVVGHVAITSFLELISVLYISLKFKLVCHLKDEFQLCDDFILERFSFCATGFNIGVDMASSVNPLNDSRFNAMEKHFMVLCRDRNTIGKYLRYKSIYLNAFTTVNNDASKTMTKWRSFKECLIYYINYANKVLSMYDGSDPLFISEDTVDEYYGGDGLETYSV